MVTEEKIRKKIKGEKTKQKLFESAAELFSKYDFNDVTVDAIVKAAGVSKGTFYIYFESKDAMIASLLTDYVRRVDTEYKSYLASLPVGTKASDMLLFLIEKIADVLTNMIGCHKMQIVYRMQLTGVVNMEAVKGYNRQLYQIFADVLHHGIKQGEFYTELSLDALTKHFVMAIRGLSYEWCIRYPDFDLREQALVHFKILLRGIQVEGHRD